MTNNEINDAYLEVPDGQVKLYHVINIKTVKAHQLLV